MNYVDSLNLFGIEAKEIPCIKGSGAPTISTEGAVGLFYMNTDNGDVYKCTAVADNIYTWELLSQGSGGIVGYYSTTREELEVEHENVNTEYILGLYDALMEVYPDKVQKYEIYNDDGSFTNYVYAISTGEYNEEDKGIREGRDYDIKKSKYLISSGIHGTERPAVLSTYRFLRDLLDSSNTINSILEGSIIHILPVATPYGFDAFSYYNVNGKNINRNFTAEVFEKETQAVANWLKANSDANLYIDFHNAGAVNEVALLIGTTDNPAVDTAKKIALRGLDRIVPYWRDVIKYSKTVKCWVSSTDSTEIEREVVFSYSMSIDTPSTAIQYALEECGITSFCLETSVYVNGNYSDYKKDEKVCTPETVASGAEALGNILVEFHEQSFFGDVTDDMTSINSKLDTIMGSVNSGFRMESGVLEVAENQVNASGVKVTIPCTNGAKLLTFQADDATYAELNTSADEIWVVGVLGNCITKVGHLDNRGYMSRRDYKEATSKWAYLDAGVGCTNTNGFSFTVGAIKKGNYNWTAYYWND